MTKITKKQEKSLKRIASEDFQNRNKTGRFLQSGTPDVVSVWPMDSQVEVEMLYKNTSERNASADAVARLNRACGKNMDAKAIARQIGEYHDDWVEVSFYITRWGN